MHALDPEAALPILGSCEMIFGWKVKEYPDGDFGPGEEIACPRRALMYDDGVNLCIARARGLRREDLLTDKGRTTLARLEAYYDEVPS